MKTRAIILLVATGLITISFTFATVNEKGAKQSENKTATQVQTEPVGGFVSADKL
jgi:hypothetical protein